MRGVRFFLLVLSLLLAWPTAAWAGMSPPPVLTEVARARLQSLSFFLVLFFVAAGVVMLLWNALRRDWTWMPRLTYRKALGVVALWGLLFVLVLAMISGARELLTPGAWERSGAQYRLSDKDRP
jgi:hypothetical protein